MQNLIVNRSDLNDVQRQAMLAELTALSVAHYDATVHLSISDAQLAKACRFARQGVITHLGELLEFAIDGLIPPNSTS